MRPSSSSEEIASARISFSVKSLNFFSISRPSFTCCRQSIAQRVRSSHLGPSCIQFFRILAGVDKLNPGNAGVPNAKANENSNEVTISGDRLAELLNEDLAREYQAIIASVVYSQALNGAEYMSIADQLQLH